MMKSQRRQLFVLLTYLLVEKTGVQAFSAPFLSTSRSSPSFARLSTRIAATQSTTTTESSFIDTELRAAAMKLHTREQAPREGQAKSEPSEPYVPTHDDYLRFLVDSQYVYQTLEDIVNEREELAAFRNTGLERVEPLEKDIEYMTKEYGLTRPEVGKPGLAYANLLRNIDSIPEFVCHYYNFYFAHTAGGRMIGKQMSALLLDNLTLEFYKWDGNLNEIKARVKDSIEEMAASWSEEERKECVAATKEAFSDGAAINSYLLAAH